jgi:hypothetical protein
LYLKARLRYQSTRGVSFDGVSALLASKDPIETASEDRDDWVAGM